MAKTTNKTVTIEETQQTVEVIPPTVNPQKLADDKYKQAANRKKELYNYYMHEEKVPVYISPQYRNELGSKVFISVNCIGLYIPADGQTYYIPKTFADELQRKRLNVDDRFLRREKMADVQNNFEQYAGDIKLF